MKDEFHSNPNLADQKLRQRCLRFVSERMQGTMPKDHPVARLCVAEQEDEIEPSVEQTHQHDESRFNRRDCLKALGTLTAASMVGRPTRSAAAIDCVYSDLPNQTQVSLVQGEVIEDSVTRAIELAGGLAEIQAGDQVLIKPNCVWPNGDQTVISDEPSAPITTDPEVLRAVLRIVAQHNQAPERIMVADHSAFLMSTTHVMKKRGLYDVIVEEGANPVAWEDTPSAPFYSSHFKYLKHPVDVFTGLLDCDHFINLPVLKNHNIPFIRHQAQYTCCLKAFVGAIPPSNRLFTKRLFHEFHLPEKAVELNLCRPYRMPDGRCGVTMNIVDATRIIVSGGPHNSIFFEEMLVEQPQMIIASKDRVACDTLALAVLKYYGLRRGLRRDYTQIPVWQQRQIQHAAHLGLGIAEPERIEIIPDGLPSQLQNQLIDVWLET